MFVGLLKWPKNSLESEQPPTAPWLRYSRELTFRACCTCYRDPNDVMCFHCIYLACCTCYRDPNDVMCFHCIYFHCIYVYDVMYILYVFTVCHHYVLYIARILYVFIDSIYI